jgi:hypothetical protein
MRDKLLFLATVMEPVPNETRHTWRPPKPFSVLLNACSIVTRSITVSGRRHQQQ